MDENAALYASHPWLAHYPDGVDWFRTFSQRPLSEVFDEAARRFGTRPCLDFLDKRYTYADVAGLIDRLACGLQKLGVGKGHHVGLFLPNTPYYVISYFAVLKIGATVVNYNPLYVARELIHQINDSATETMITLDLVALTQKLTPLVDTTALRRIILCRLADCLPFPKNLLFPIVKRAEVAHLHFDARYISFASLAAHHGSPQPVAIDPVNDVAVLQYTGGTTGIPKGAMLTHANLWANAEQCVAWFPDAVPGHERMLAVLPFFHVFAMTVALNAAVVLGAEIVLMPRFDLDDLLAVIDRKKPSLFPAVPTIYTAINTHPKRAHHDLSSIRFCISGGAPLPQDVRRGFESATGCVLIEGYGLSEASPVACINPISENPRVGSVGLPVPGTMVEILDLVDDVTVLPPGQRGQICIRGPQVMKGYWNRPQDTAQVLRNGRLYTGDVGVMDEDGFTMIVDRIKDVILCGGFNVYPRNVEEAIYLHPAVEEVVVAGLPDPYRGQTVKAYIKLDREAVLDENTLLAFLKDKLSPIEMPKIIEFRDALPKTMVGKISRKDLLEEEHRRREGAGTGTLVSG